MAFDCPACKQEFTKIEFGRCPHCKARLKRHQYTSDGVQRAAYELLNQSEMAGTIQKIAAGQQVQDVTGLVLSLPGVNPQVTLISKEPRIINVTYQYEIPMGAIYCPDCHRFLFQNMIVQTKAGFEHKCGRCKTTIQFTFISSYLTYSP